VLSGCAIVIYSIHVYLVGGLGMFGCLLSIGRSNCTGVDWWWEACLVKRLLLNGVIEGKQSHRWLGRWGV